MSKLYLLQKRVYQEHGQFQCGGENGYVSTWKFPRHFTCDSDNVLYVCKILVDEKFSLGRTMNVKKRTAKHISDVFNPANSKCKEFT